MAAGCLEIGRQNLYARLAFIEINYMCIIDAIQNLFSIELKTLKTCKIGRGNRSHMQEDIKMSETLLSVVSSFLCSHSFKVVSSLLIVANKARIYFCLSIADKVLIFRYKGIYVLD